MSKRVAAQEAFKLALSMVLMFWLALWMDWEMPGNGGLAIILVSLGTAGASFNKGVMRIVGTTIGLLVGFVALGLFGQSPWGTLIFFTIYIVIIGYIMQSTSFSYAWFVAGFLPLLVWSSVYGSSNYGSAAFHYGSFRYLETTVGIVIYTVVSVVIWPIRAGDQLPGAGKDLWAGVRAVFGAYRALLDPDENDDPKREAELAGQQAKLAGALARFEATLMAAYGDSSGQRNRKKLWEVMRVNLHTLVECLELWGDSVRDCRALDMEKRIPGLAQALAKVDSRLERISALGTGAGECPDHDAALLSELPFAIADWQGRVENYHEMAALQSFFLQLRLLDRLSRELLHETRQLAGLDRESLPEMVAADRLRRVIWDPHRIVKALFPATCFVVAFLFWIFFDPPGGTSIPSLTVVISLNFVLSRMNPTAMLVILFVGLWVCVAPVYMWIMPALDSGAGLLAVIFLYTFFFGFIGANKKALKLIPILLLVEVTGISNQQTYSFMALIGGAQVLLLCLVIIAVVDMLWAPRRPEQDFLRALREFFRACATIMASYGLGHSGPPGDRDGRSLRRRSFHANVLGVSGKLRATAKHLDPKRFPGCDADGIKALSASLQTIALRLQATEFAHHQLESQDLNWRDHIGPSGDALRELIHGAFLALARLDECADGDEWRTTLQRISDDLRQQLAAADSGPDASLPIHALLGSVRGLLVAIEQARAAMQHFDWGKLSRARF